MGVTTACTACGRTLQRRSDSRTSYTYLTCAYCGLGVLDPWPDADSAEPYDEGYFVGGGHRAGYASYEADARWHRHTAVRRLNRVADALGQSDDVRLLDVGAAVGFVLDEALSRGWTAVGMERSRWAAERARQRGHVMVSRWDDPGLQDGTLGAVTFFQVLEHIPDPASALRKAYDLLSPGGVLVCETWDASSRTARWAGSRWQQLSPPSVLWLFTPVSAGLLVERAGFRRVSWRPTWKMVGAGTVIGQSLRARHGRSAHMAAGVASAMGLPYVFDDLVTFVARKPW